ncbi:MAG: hypothetical protein QW328_09630, partial [Nitrososphaerota archaeon]
MSRGTQRCYVVFYSTVHNPLEKPPSWSQESRSGVHQAHSGNDSSIVFLCVDAEYWEDPETEIQACINQIIPAGIEKLSVLCYHGFEVMAGKLLFRTADTVIISYSSQDPQYFPMWERIRASRSFSDLKNCLEYWIQYYTINPIRRIKHRAMNLFAPLDTDCQYLLELWKRGEYDKARHHLEDMQKDWQGDPPYSNAPLSKLARLWYLLIGDKMEWSYQVTEVGDSTWSHISIKKPDVVISLPKKRATDEVGMCFYDWLVKIGKTGSQNWQNLLSRAGLSKPNNNFSPKSEAGIY